MSNFNNDLALNQGKKAREIGVEILRIIAMLLIVCQHFLNHGGFLKNAGEYSFFLNFINVLFAPSVNIFVIISGYFSLSARKLKLNKIAALWVQVLFYSLVMLLVSASLGATINDVTVYQSFFPIIFKRYWFFSAYFLLVLITPFLSAMINAISQREHLALVIGTLVCGYLSTRFDISATLSFNYGYSVLWFCLMFIVGAYLKKYPIRVKKIYLAIAYVAMTAMLMLFKYYCNDTSKLIFKLFYNSTDYNQPLTILSAICLFLLFLGIKNNGGRVHKFITYIATLTFGAYLIHEAPTFRRLLYDVIFKTSSYHGTRFGFLYVLLFALITFIVCCVIDSLRIVIFKFVTFIFLKIKNRIKVK